MPVTGKRTITAKRRNSADPRPISTWTQNETGRRFTTVTVRQDDGSFLCLVAEDPTIRETAATAKKAASAIFQRMREPRNSLTESTTEEDADDVRVARQRLRQGKFISQEQFLKWFHSRHARR